VIGIDARGGKDRKDEGEAGWQKKTPRYGSVLARKKKRDNLVGWLVGYICGRRSSVAYFFVV